MPSYKVKVKWNKEIFSDVELTTEEAPIVFKAQLFALTGVQTDRQKLMFKGATIKDDDWNNLQIKDGITLLMMGTADELPQEPAQKTVFIEDMDESQKAKALELPAGIQNLGNTCYMNATVQCLRTVPELVECLKNYNTQSPTGAAGAPDNADRLTIALRDLYTTMDGHKPDVAPLFLLSTLHNIFPRFAERGEGGVFQQQDANEFWTELIRMLQQKLKTPEGKNFIDQYFSGVFDIEMRCTECPEEGPVYSSENFLQLSCFISQEVKYLQSGLKSRLTETIEKFSPTLNKNAKYEKISKIGRLPAYLAINFIRFEFKAGPTVNAKILKDVKFTISLDLYELCSPQLQQKLNPMRHKFKEFEDKKLEETQKLKSGGQQEGQKKEKYRHKYWFDDDIGSNNSGYYELRAVLTHKGRTSSSGHYVGWIRRSENEWFKCDDDVVSAVTTEEILKLSGGGDWHTAYVLLYGPRILTTDEPPTDPNVLMN